ncbi:hypothetical protein vBSlqSZDD2_33 [Serratia phage vB_SlqS_ZDD2]|nr:hypothetical protein vBSlqSZDD2_33 [Serratia phage vB_SlqS_ZDD2]
MFLVLSAYKVAEGGRIIGLAERVINSDQVASIDVTTISPVDGQLVEASIVKMKDGETILVDVPMDYLYKGVGAIALTSEMAARHYANMATQGQYNPDTAHLQREAENKAMSDLMEKEEEE